MRPGSKEIYKERGGADSLYYQLGIPIPEFPESSIHGIPTVSNSQNILFMEFQLLPIVSGRLSPLNR